MGKLLDRLLIIMLVVSACLISITLQGHADEVVLTDLKINEELTSQRAVLVGNSLIYDEDSVTVDMTWSDGRITTAKKDSEEWTQVGLTSEVSSLEGAYALSVYSDEFSEGLPLSVYQAEDNKEVLSLAQPSPIQLSDENPIGIWSFTPDKRGIYQFQMQTQTGNAKVKYYLTDGQTNYQSDTMGLSQTVVTGEDLVLKKGQEYFLIGFYSDYSEQESAIVTVQSPEIDALELELNEQKNVLDNVEYLNVTAPEEGLYVLKGFSETECSVVYYSDGKQETFTVPQQEGVIAQGVSYLGWMSLFYFFPAMTNGVQGFFRGMGRMKMTLYGTITQISFRVLFVYLLAPSLGVTGVAFASAIGWSFMLLLEIPFVVRGLRQMKE